MGSSFRGYGGLGRLGMRWFFFGGWGMALWGGAQGWGLGFWLGFGVWGRGLEAWDGGWGLV